MFRNLTPEELKLKEQYEAVKASALINPTYEAIQLVLDVHRNMVMHRLNSGLSLAEFENEQFVAFESLLVDLIGLWLKASLATFENFLDQIKQAKSLFKAILVSKFASKKLAIHAHFILFSLTELAIALKGQRVDSKAKKLLIENCFLYENIKFTFDDAQMLLGFMLGVNLDLGIKGIYGKQEYFRAILSRMTSNDEEWDFIVDLLERIDQNQIPENAEDLEFKMALISELFTLWEELVLLPDKQQLKNQNPNYLKSLLATRRMERYEQVRPLRLVLNWYQPGYPNLSEFVKVWSVMFDELEITDVLKSDQLLVPYAGMIDAVLKFFSSAEIGDTNYFPHSPVAEIWDVKLRVLLREAAAAHLKAFLARQEGKASSLPEVQNFLTALKALIPVQQEVASSSQSAVAKEPKPKKSVQKTQIIIQAPPADPAKFSDLHPKLTQEDLMNFEGQLKEYNLKQSANKFNNPGKLSDAGKNILKNKSKDYEGRMKRIEEGVAALKNDFKQASSQLPLESSDQILIDLYSRMKTLDGLAAQLDIDMKETLARAKNPLKKQITEKWHDTRAKATTPTSAPIAAHAPNSVASPGLPSPQSAPLPSRSPDTPLDPSPPASSTSPFFAASSPPRAPGKAPNNLIPPRSSPPPQRQSASARPPLPPQPASLFERANLGLLFPGSGASSSKPKGRHVYSFRQNLTASVSFDMSTYLVLNPEEQKEFLATKLREHAAQRVINFVLLLVAYSNTDQVLSLGSTNQQYGAGSQAAGTQACHSSIIPSVWDDAAHHSSILDGTHFLRTLNITYEFPPFVNALDNVLEKARPAFLKIIQNAARIVNPSMLDSAGEKFSLREAIKAFLMEMNKQLACVSRKLFEPYLIEAVKVGTFTKESFDEATLDFVVDEWMNICLDVDMAELRRKHSPIQVEEIVDAKVKALQKQILTTKAAPGSEAHSSPAP